jgi:hypothetical protein
VLVGRVSKQFLKQNPTSFEIELGQIDFHGVLGVTKCEKVGKSCQEMLTIRLSKLFLKQNPTSFEIEFFRN